MRIFVTGASGWVGSALVPELQAAGHSVVGLARSGSAASSLADRDVEVVRADMTDLAAMSAAARDADAVIHLAFNHDFSHMQESVAEDAALIAAFGDALEGTGKALTIASGTPAIPGQVATEHDRAAAGTPASGRDDNGYAVLALADRGVRSSVVRLPRSVHGAGEQHGFISRLSELARTSSVSGYVADGTQRWPAVHVLDAAVLFRLAIEQAEPGTMLHAVGDEGVPTRQIAALLGAQLGVPTAERPAPDFGFLGGLLSIDQPASASWTREALGWEPTHPSLVEDIEAGHYTT
ncbi:SDR family oxidoreductase [Flexivirga sp. ID2601S]|uniref:SDR family oxidoreductase n=1 Tax=Flexivirga aerilata TaxID=1656889 RepID=A0A849AHY3_9MICO|nr:SDR family oxidoreductase [Flexivirga aerilata]NNG40454.1 SDR family oxidoreductase [Flexivirga aerilata]